MQLVPFHYSSAKGACIEPNHLNRFDLDFFSNGLVQLLLHIPASSLYPQGIDSRETTDMGESHLHTHIPHAH